MSEQKYAVILFDGVCNFCNFWINIVLDRDKNNKFKFASLQSAYGREQQKRFGLPPDELSTVILIKGDSFYTKSTAALKIAKELSGPLSWLYPLIFIPRFLRDFFYTLIAKNRYRLFGKREACRIPTPEERNKFIEEQEKVV